MGWTQKWLCKAQPPHPPIPPHKRNRSLQEPQINNYWPKLNIVWPITTRATTETFTTTTSTSATRSTALEASDYHLMTTTKYNMISNNKLAQNNNINNKNNNKGNSKNNKKNQQQLQQQKNLNIIGFDIIVIIPVYLLLQ